MAKALLVLPTSGLLRLAAMQVPCSAVPEDHYKGRIAAVCEPCLPACPPCSCCSARLCEELVLLQRQT